jgi:hypothetical protein
MTEKLNPQDQALNIAAPAGFDAQAVPIHEVCIDQPKVATHALDQLVFGAVFRTLLFGSQKSRMRVDMSSLQISFLSAKLPVR